MLQNASTSTLLQIPAAFFITKCGTILLQNEDFIRGRYYKTRQLLQNGAVQRCRSLKGVLKHGLRFATVNNDYNSHNNSNNNKFIVAGL